MPSSAASSASVRSGRAALIFPAAAMVSAGVRRSCGLDVADGSAAACAVPRPAPRPAPGRAGRAAAELAGRAVAVVAGRAGPEEVATVRGRRVTVGANDETSGPGVL